MTDKQFIALRLLQDHPLGAYGLELVKASGGILKRGTIYVHLSNLEGKFYVTSRKGDLTGRRIYTITEHGKRALNRGPACSENGILGQWSAA